MNKKLIIGATIGALASSVLIYSGVKSLSRAKLRERYSLEVRFMDLDDSYKTITFGLDHDINGKEFDLIILNTTADMQIDRDINGQYTIDLVNRILYSLRELSEKDLLEEDRVKFKILEISRVLNREVKLESFRK